VDESLVLSANKLVEDRYPMVFFLPPLEAQQCVSIHERSSSPVNYFLLHFNHPFIFYNILFTQIKIIKSADLKLTTSNRIHIREDPLSSIHVSKWSKWYPFYCGWTGLWPKNEWYMPNDQMAQSCNTLISNR
jgi:hypothetical protein